MSDEEKKPPEQEPAPEPTPDAAALVAGDGEPTPEADDEYGKEFDRLASDEPTPTEPIPEPAKSAEPEDIGSSQAADEGKPEKTPEPEPEKAPEPAAKPEPTPDIWAGATPEAKAAYEAADKDAHKWQSDTGRAGRDAARIASLERQITASAAPVKAAVKQENAPADVLAGEDWKAVETELPELATPLKNVLTGLLAENVALKKDVSTIIADRGEQTLATQQTILSNEHSDWESVTADQKFQDWVGAQPVHVQRMFDRNAEQIVDGLETADLLSRYKTANNVAPPVPVPPGDGSSVNQPAPKSNGGEPNKRARDSQARLEGNVSVPSKGPGAPSGAPEEYGEAFKYYVAHPT